MDSLLIIFQVLIRLRDNSKLIPEFGQFAAAVVKLLDGRELKDIVTLIAHTVPNIPFLSKKSNLLFASKSFDLARRFKLFDLRFFGQN